EESAVRPESDIGGSNEPAPSACRLLAYFYAQKLLSFGTELQHDGTGRIHGPNITCGIDSDAVRNFVQPLSPTTYDLPITIHHDHGILLVAPLQQVDPPLTIDIDPRNHTQFESFGRRMNVHLRAPQDLFRRLVE